MRITVNEQPDQNRWVLHLLHYIPERRGEDFDVIEDVIPLFDLRLSVRTFRRVKEVTRIPEGETLPFEQSDGRIELTLPELDGHQMLSLDLE